jgi:MYXO-CTERM domain-containing protein
MQRACAVPVGGFAARRPGCHNEDVRLALAFVLTLLAAAGAGAQAPPALNINAPPDLVAARGRLASFDLEPLAGIVRIVGLDDAGPPIDVVLAGEDSDAARSVPAWTAGFAISNAGLIVLFPSRSPNYPHDTLEDVLRHEVAHVLIGRAAGGRPVPRWFHEGLAVAVERPWDLEDRSRLAWELLAGPRLTLRDIDALFEGGQGEQSRAYSLAAAVVRDLMSAHGSAAPASVLGLVRDGRPFDDAVVAVTGRPIAAVEDSFWDRQRVWTVWIPFLTSSSVVWLGVIVLAAFAVWRRRRRGAELRRQWAEAERASALRRLEPDDEEGDERIH